MGAAAMITENRRRCRSTRGMNRSHRRRRLPAHASSPALARRQVARGGGRGGHGGALVAIIIKSPSQSARLPLSPSRRPIASPASALDFGARGQRLREAGELSHATSCQFGFAPAAVGQWGR